jgi:hypothetical protein
LRGFPLPKFGDSASVFSFQKRAAFRGWQSAAGVLTSAPSKNNGGEATMNAGTVYRLLSLIPERTGRPQSGAVFHTEASFCSQPERLAHVSRFLTWLSPLQALSREEQRALGLAAANGRQVQAAEEQDSEELELDTASFK